MNDIIRCTKPDCKDMAVIVSGGLCFTHIKIALFGGQEK